MSLSPRLRIDKRTESSKIKVMKKVKAAKEKISHAPGEEEAWICLCGNRPADDGFYPCDKEGNEMEPVKGWEDLYVCASCGRIIQQTTLEVVGRNPQPILLQ
jgi:hypothetical protein